MAAGLDASSYVTIAEGYESEGQAQLRDRFLVLAADAALTSGNPLEAENLRHRLLKYNPHHLLKPFQSFAQAMQSADVQNYVNALRRSHPPERIQELLSSFKTDAVDADREAVDQVFRLRTDSKTNGAKPEEKVAVRNSQRDARIPPGPEIFAVRPDKPAAPPRESYSEFEPVSGPGRFIVLLLGGLVAICGLLAAGYTLLHPYLPRIF
jgi:hypothetical protein